MAVFEQYVGLQRESALPLCEDGSRDRVNVFVRHECLWTRKQYRIHDDNDALHYVDVVGVWVRILKIESNC